MRKVLIVAVALTAMLAIETSAQASQRRVIYRPARTWQINSGGNPVSGVFGRLMELERAKNAWLFGR